MSILAVHPTKGHVYAGSNDPAAYGFYRSVDGFSTFSRYACHPASLAPRLLCPLIGALLRPSYKLNALLATAVLRDPTPVYGLAVPNAPDGSPDDVYIASASGILLSQDAGATFKPAGRGQGLPLNETLRRITVSPADATHMSCWHMGESYRYTQYYTIDGGDTWSETAWDNALAFMPYNARAGITAYHPTNASIMWGNGGDWITRSEDGGATLHWAANGYNAVMAGGGFAFHPDTPDALFVSFQDYGGSLTRDGGHTWTYANVSGNTWGGQGYGGAALGANASVMVVGNSYDGWDGPRILTVSHDGGNTWVTAKNASQQPIIYGGLDIASRHPTLAQVGFASRWRTTDGGATWEEMSNCDGVLTSGGNSGSIMLFGASKDSVVVSRDDGNVWVALATPQPGSPLRDVAWDDDRGRIYAAVDDRLYACTWNGIGTERAGASCQSTSANASCFEVSIPRDQFNNTRVKSVAVDPSNHARVAVGSAKDVYATSVSVAGSTDGGKTWRNLLPDTPLPRDPQSVQGPHEVSWLRFHPHTGELWVAGGCFGLWKVSDF
jgi:hypothetical protein